MTDLTPEDTAKAKRPKSKTFCAGCGREITHDVDHVFCCEGVS